MFRWNWECIILALIRPSHFFVCQFMIAITMIRCGISCGPYCPMHIRTCIRMAESWPRKTEEHYQNMVGLDYQFLTGHPCTSLFWCRKYIYWVAETINRPVSIFCTRQILKLTSRVSKSGSGFRFWCVWCRFWYHFHFFKTIYGQVENLMHKSYTWFII